MEEIKAIVSEYNSDDVFNMDETSIFLQLRAESNIGYKNTIWEEEAQGAD